MDGLHRVRGWRTGFFAVWLIGGLAASLAMAQAPDAAKRDEKTLPRPRPLDDEKAKKIAEEVEKTLPQMAPSILPPLEKMHAIDLGCALRLAGVENPDILIARQEVTTARAQRLSALAWILPTLNAGMNYDAHTGPLQQSSGNILKVNREAFYLGGGAGAVAAGTVGIPMVQYILNFSEGLFHFYSTRYHVQVRQAESVAVRNQIFLRVTQAYMDLLHGQGWRYIALQNRKEAHEIARLTAVNAFPGIGRIKKSDADRAAAELALRNDEVVQAEQEIRVASARLVQLLNLPPTIQLHVEDAWLVPSPLVPDPIPLHDLLLIAMGQRPELAARRAAIREAILLMRNEAVLPFSPTILAGFSAGTFGGGSNLIGQPGGFQGFAEARFGSFAQRTDVDVVMFWTAQNAGLGNLAKYLTRRSMSRETEFELTRELNRVRFDVASSFARTHARYAQIGIAERGMEAGNAGFREDLSRIMAGVGLPLELLDNFRLLAEARMHVLDAVVNYNKAQFALFVALGQPPPRFLAKVMPANVVPRPNSAPPLPACAGPNGANCAPPAKGVPAVLPASAEAARLTPVRAAETPRVPATTQAATFQTESPK